MTEQRLAEIEARAREAGRSAKDPRSASICMVTVPELTAAIRAAEAREARLREALGSIERMKDEVVLTPDDYGPMEAGPTDGDIWQAGATAAFKEAAKIAHTALEQKP